MIAEFGLVIVGTMQFVTGLPISQDDLQIVVDQGLCVEYVDEALAAGWPSENIPRLMRIMERESKCDPFACGETDSPRVRKCRDWGLMQINDYSWKTTIRSMGLSMDQMHDPFWNLFFARWLYDTAVATHGCGWEPWRGRC